MELSMCAFLSASFQKCMPLGGTATMAAWGWQQESWTPRDAAAGSTKSSLAHRWFSDTHKWGFENKHIEIKCTQINIHAYIFIYTYTYVSMDSGIWQVLALWDGHGRDLYPGALSPVQPLPQLGYFPFSYGRLPYSCGPQHGQERRDGVIGHIAITLCGRRLFPSSVSSGVSAQFERNPIRLSHSILSEVSPQWEEKKRN